MIMTMVMKWKKKWNDNDIENDVIILISNEMKMKMMK